MRKDEIIKVALRLFLSRGYRYVSLNDIAEELGITKGGIYHYFSSKEELLRQAAEFFFENIKAKHIEVFSNDKSLREILQEAIIDNEVEIHIDKLIGFEHDGTAKDEMGIIFEIMTLCPEMPQRLARDNMEMIAAIKGKLQRLMDKGEMRSDIDVNAITTILFTILIGRKTIPMQYADKRVREQVVENFCKLVSKG
ncbi:MAG: ttgR [Firmicutes bacterium]|nr:ttgR [Bacillota bacterium]